MAGLNDAHRAAEIVRDAGGHIVGRTRLQKIAYILEAAGLGGGFPVPVQTLRPVLRSACRRRANRPHRRHVARTGDACHMGRLCIRPFIRLLPQDDRTPEARRRSRKSWLTRMLSSWSLPRPRSF